MARSPQHGRQRGIGSPVRLRGMAFVASKADDTLPFVEIRSADGKPSLNEHDALVKAIDRCGVVCYRLSDAVDDPYYAVSRLAKALGLRHADQLVRHGESGLTELRDDWGNDGASERNVTPNASHRVNPNTVTPYTNRKLNWHTDGYANPSSRPIRTFLLHCVSPSASGGENLFMNTEVALALLEDANPEAAELLRHPKALVIPAYIDDNIVIRSARYAPVFAFERSGGYRPLLVTRFTLRQRNIEWRNPDTAMAAKLLGEIIENAHPHHMLQVPRANEGVISRNILHCRQNFVDSELSVRRLLRGRYYDRVTSPVVEFSAPRFGV